MKLTSSVEGRQYLVSIFTEYLSQKHIHEIEDMKNVVETGIIINVDAMILVQEHAWLSWYLLNDAIRLLELFNAALRRVVCGILGDNHSPLMSPKCIVRLTSVPICEETSRTRMPRCADVGHLLSISATVLHASPLQVLQYQRQYQCHKCAHTFLCFVSESDASYTIVVPRDCPSCGKPSPKPLSTTTTESADCRNRQQLRIQEQTRYLAIGMMPRSITVILDDDLVDCAQPGDDVIVIGTVIRRWKKHRPNEQCDAELVVLANNIQVTNHSQIDSQTLNFEAKEEFQSFWDGYGTRRLSARNAILSQMCPLIYGMYYLKLALALVLTGSSSSNFNGLKVRGESHLLLIGDPGTAKSQFLKFASKVVPRSVMTTGIGSTSAGLTVTAVKEAGDWSLEAGALVLADGGVCCIDEFGGMREQDKVAIHEAMEQQTISVAKAGIVCKLRTRCSIIAATNPRGCYDLDRSVSCNTSIASPLLSRFDLIFLLLDNCNETWDRCVSDFILNDHQSTITSRTATAPTDDDNHSNNHLFNHIEKLKSYFVFVKSSFNPQMTPEASQILEKYYSYIRRGDQSVKNLDRITMRFLESLIRLSQSHARLMMRDSVVLEDAIMAVAVMESTIYGSTILSVEQQLPSEFPVDPDEEYETLKSVIINKLDIEPTLSTAAVDNVIVSKKPLIRRRNYETQPLPARPKKREDGRAMNRSVLDNFHIATQIRGTSEDSRGMREVTVAETLFEGGEGEDSGGRDRIDIAKRIGTIGRNMFADSIAGLPSLTDADFDV